MYAMTNQRQKNERGQVLLLAVIIMLLVALIAATFIATVAHDITASDRESDSVQARNLAEAGIRYVSEQLNRYGADWRPGPGGAPGDPSYWDEVEIARDWDTQGYVKYPHPDGVNSPTPQDPTYNQVDHFLVRVDYDPEAGDMLSKCLRISAIGRPGNNPHVFHRKVAYKPIGLTDYAWFVTDGTHQPGAAVLGLPWIDINGDGVQQAAEEFSFLVDGPVRSNKDLVWDAPVAVNLAAGEQVLVAGQISHAVNGVPNSAVTINVNGTPVGPSGSAAFPVGNPQYRDHYPASGDPLRAVRRLTPPSLGLDDPDPVTGRTRYEELTKYSGEDRSGYNTGEYGYGQGIYIDNAADRQDPEDVRNEWLQPNNWGGRVYTPRGVEIVLFPTDQGHGSADPDLRIMRHDGSTWYDTSTDPPMNTGSPDAYFDYPLNGVIYAEGNIRIRGVLPVSDPTSARALDPSWPQDYNLTVVSGGIIYVEGNLLRPYETDDDPYNDSATDPANTRIALLAREHVVINPTQFCVQANTNFITDNPDDPHWVLDSTSVEAAYLSFSFGKDPVAYLSNPPAEVWLTVKHAEQTSRDAYTDATYANIGLFRGWNFNLPPVWQNPTSDWRPGMAATGDVVYPESYDYVALNYLPDSWQLPDPTDILWGPGGIQAGQEYVVRLQRDSSSADKYHLTNAKIERVDRNGNLVAGLELVVSALLYAEQGSFFIIPGDWFDASIPTVADAGNATNYARFRRYNYQIIVNGAISVNDTPALPHVGEWSDKWSYPDPALASGWNTVEYHYDGGLASARAPDLPRLPHLPVSEDLLFMGQEE